MMHILCANVIQFVRPNVAVEYVLDRMIVLVSLITLKMPMVAALPPVQSVRLQNDFYEMKKKTLLKSIKMCA